MTTIGKKVRWISIVRPTEKDLKWIERTYKVHPLIVDELKGPSARERVESQGHYVYLVYYFPFFDTKERVSRRNEIDFLITAKDVITVSYEHIDVLAELMKTLTPRDRALDDTVKLTHKIMEALLLFQERQLTHIREKVDEVSEELFRRRERERERGLLEKISYLKRDISQYRIIVSPQKHILESLMTNANHVWGAHAHIYLADLLGEHLKIRDQLENYRTAIEDFEETNNQLINLKTTQVTKTFTILAFLTFPMMLLAAIFSMNTIYTPLVEHPWGFWIIFGIMAVAMSGMVVYFKRRDWI